MYYELFNKVFEENESKICIFEIGKKIIQVLVEPGVVEEK